MNPRPKDFSTLATLVHRLCHPLHIQRVRYDGAAPASQSGSVRTDSDKRRQRTSHGSSRELVEVQNKGDYTQQRYGDLHTYWNSVMVEASEGEKESRKVGAAGKRREIRRGRVFDDSEQSYKAYNDRQCADGGSANGFTVAVQHTSFHPDALATDLSLKRHTGTLSNQPTNSCLNINDDRYVTLTESTSVVKLPATEAEDQDAPRLTWNSALTRILASPAVDLEISAAIRARANGGRKSTEHQDVDMREVGMVPNFTYPIADARWCERCDIKPLDLDKEDKLGQVDTEIEQQGRGFDWNGDGNSNITIEHCPSISSGSLYRPPMPVTRKTSNPGSVLCEILDADELNMYQQIVSHDPRFTVLLDGADVLTRQVSLIQKLHFAIEVLTERLEGCVLQGLPHHRETKEPRHEPNHKALVIRDERIKDLATALNFSNRVIEMCLKRGRSILDMLIHFR